MPDALIEFDDEEEPDFEIEVDDDTPIEDRDREVADPESKDFDESDLPTEEELLHYSKGAASRIRQLTKKFHNERRAKESLNRELDQAASFGKAKLSENDNLRKQLQSVASNAVSSYKERYEGELTDLKTKLAQAVDVGDGKAVADLTEKISDAKASIKDALQAQEQLKKSPAQEPVQAEVDPADPVHWPAVRRKWAEKNGNWFGKDEEMTALTYAVHGKLVKEGVQPDTQEYFDKIDKRIREKFPESFDDEVEMEDDEPAPRPRRAEQKTSDMAGGLVKKTVRGGKTIYKITGSQKALCKRLGITPQEYIAELNKKDNDDE